MSVILRSIIFIILILFSTSCDNSSSDKVIVSFSNDVNSTTISLKRALQINVYTNYSDGTKKNIASDLIWSSSNENIATVNAGLIQANDIEGSVSISYKTQDNLSDGTPIESQNINFSIQNLTITNITLSKTNLNLSVGTSTSVAAIATFDNNSTLDITNEVSWYSSDLTTCSVKNGTIKAISEGNSTIIAIDSNITSSPLEVEVNKVYFTGINIQTSKNSFNVEQTISLQTVATTSNNETVILNNDDVEYESIDTKTITIQDATVTAMTKGDANITATLKADRTLSNSVILNVIKDKYMRLFDKNGNELDFTSTQLHEFKLDSNSILDTFTLKAVGDDFQIILLNITDFNGVSIGTNNLEFVDLNIFDEIKSSDGNITFKLSHAGIHKQISYIFTIDDEVKSVFKQNYKALSQ